MIHSGIAWCIVNDGGLFQMEGVQWCVIAAIVFANHIDQFCLFPLKV